MSRFSTIDTERRHVRVLTVERFDLEELLARLRRTRLRGHGGIELYANASLEFVAGIDPQELSPAQNYVLRPGVERILELRQALLEEDVDVFALHGGAWVTTFDDPRDRIPVIPPVVEESVEPDGRSVLLVNDGIHRVFAARELGLPISVVVVRGVPAQYPYYAFALPGGWSDVAVFEEIPDGHQKKQYRQPQSYKSLFRDFNAVFPGVQKDRKKSNPAHLVS